MVASVCYASLVSASADRDSRLVSRDLNIGATIQPDPSREIYITKAHNTLQFIPTMAADTLSGMSLLRISPGLGVL